MSDIYESGFTAEQFEAALKAVPSIGENGNWFIGGVDTGVPARGVAVSEAKVGQIIVVKAVDENGKPTEWECVDLPSACAEPIWEDVVTHTIEAEASTWSYDFDATDEILVIATGLKCTKGRVCIDMCVNDGELSTASRCMTTGEILHDTAPTTLMAHIKAIDDGLFKGEHYVTGGAGACVWRGGIGIHPTNNKTRKITKFAIAAQAFGTNKLTAGTITIKRRVN